MRLMACHGTVRPRSTESPSGPHSAIFRGRIAIARVTRKPNAKNTNPTVPTMRCPANWWFMASRRSDPAARAPLPAAMTAVPRRLVDSVSAISLHQGAGDSAPMLTGRHRHHCSDLRFGSQVSGWFACARHPRNGCGRRDPRELRRPSHFLTRSGAVSRVGVGHVATSRRSPSLYLSPSR
jgi:hypothetical protein